MVVGLEGGGLTLQNSGGESIEIERDGAFEFSTPMAFGATYTVTVASQPSSPTQTCTVANGSGRITSDAPVANIMVSCHTGMFVIGGTVTGLAGAGLVLENNGTDELAISADGSFSFPTPIPSGAAFAVTVKTQPSSPTQTCTVGGGAGTMGARPVSTIVVDCATDKFVVGGIVSGLAGTVVVQNRAGDDITVSANGSFAFPTTVASGAAYDVTVLSQPDAPSQTCTVTSGGSGTVTDADITSVRVQCTTNELTIGGSVSGLAGSGLVLQNNGGDNLAVSANGSFELATPIASGSTYAVTVLAQPSNPTQVCSVANASGSVGSANVTNVAVTCSTSAFPIGGAVIGLAGSGLVLQDNGGDDLTIDADGTFTFSTPVASGAQFAVTVSTQPEGPTQTCDVSGGSGTVGAGGVTSVVVNCATNTYTIGGTVTGLAGTAVLHDNGGDALTLTANGSFAFSTPIASGATYAVSVQTQPISPSQICVVTNDTGSVVDSNVTNVAVTCTTNKFTVGGTVSGLAGSGLVVRNNGGPDISVAANGSFTLPAIDSGTTYAVTVTSQPTGPSQTCVATNATGVVGGAAVTDVAVTCKTNTYSIGGSVSGLVGGGLVLQDNGGNDLAISANGTFYFTAEIASGDSYAVTVFAQPTSPWQKCVVTGGAGNVTDADITSIAVTCSTNKYYVGGTVTGLAGTGLVLQNNGGDNLAVTSNGTFTFAAPITSGTAFDVTVLEQPSGVTQTCSVTGGNGTIGGGDVTSVTINCATNSYTISGTASGLAGSGLFLQLNGGNNLQVSANGTFSFSTTIASGGAYAVSVFAHPSLPSQTCIVAQGVGTVTNAAISDVAVTCTTNRYAIGGSVSGLAVGNTIVLRNNGADDLARSTNGTFTFPVTIASGQLYAVTAQLQAGSPISQTCSVTNGSAVVDNAAVTNVAVTCTTNTFTVGGSVSGLTATGLVLRNNGGNDLSIAGNGSFTFTTAVPSGSSYAVTVATHPSGQACWVTNGSGTVAAANITNVAIACGPAVTGDYAGWRSATQNAGRPNVLIPGDTITEANTYGGFYFTVDSSVTRVRVTISGAGGSSISGEWDSYAGGSGGTGTFDIYPSFLASQGRTSFWIVSGQAGRPSAGPAGDIAAYRAFNGGGAGTDWSGGTGTYDFASGGGGGTDLRFTYDGSASNPLVGNPTNGLATRFAVVGGGGGATANGSLGGLGGGLNLNGGDSTNCCGDPGLGATTTSPGFLNGAFGIGGDGLQDGSEGWAGGGGGGYFGGGASPAHDGGGGGSGFLMSIAGLVQIGTSSGVQGGNASQSSNGAFTITAY
jgi:large repetitive protein